MITPLKDLAPVSTVFTTTSWSFHLVHLPTLILVHMLLVLCWSSGLPHPMMETVLGFRFQLLCGGATTYHTTAGSRNKLEQMVQIQTTSMISVMNTICQNPHEEHFPLLISFISYVGSHCWFTTLGAVCIYTLYLIWETCVYFLCSKPQTHNVCLMLTHYIPAL